MKHPEKKINLQPVILCGGSGTRLWPLSRAGFPKQFLVLAGNESLFQQAVQRLAGLAADDLVLAAPLIVGNEEHRFLMLDQATRAAWEQRSTDAKFIRPGKAEFTAIPAESVDYAVMEHCPGSEFPIKMVPLAASWSDLGAWDAVWQVSAKDEAGNAHIGDVLATDNRNTLVHATSRLVSLVGVDNLVVIETPDAVLIADRAHCQDVKAIVAKLHASGREEHTLHRKVHRPWGWYDSIDEGGRFKVKRIQVKSKAHLSLQKDHHRAEHWIVVKSTAEITCNRLHAGA